MCPLMMWRCSAPISRKYITLYLFVAGAWEEEVTLIGIKDVVQDVQTAKYPPKVRLGEYFENAQIKQSHK